MAAAAAKETKPAKGTAGHYTVVDGVLVWVKAKPATEAKSETPAD